MNEKLEAKITFAGSFMPYGRHLIEEDDIEAVVEVLHGEYLTTGPTVEAFEAELALTVRCNYAVSVSSGTAALQAARMGARIKLTLSPIPPEECLSRIGPSKSASDQSSTVPE